MGDTPTIPNDPTDTSSTISATGADKVDPQVLDALTIKHLETIANASGTSIATLMQHQINHARRLDTMSEACFAKMLKRFAKLDPVEVVATDKILKSESDSSIASLLAQLSAGQLSGKIAQSTQSNLALEISRMGSAIAEMHGLLNGIIGLVQQSLINGTYGIPVAPVRLSNTVKSDPVPAPIPIPDPKPASKPSSPTDSLWPESIRFPRVTIRF